MEILMLGAILGLIPGLIAYKKGRSFFLFWIYGTLIFIVALPHALMMSAGDEESKTRGLLEGTLRRCPLCDEVTDSELAICSACKRDLPEFNAANSILLEAALRGLVDDVAGALNSGAEINVANPNGATALFLAAVQNRPDLVQILLNRGADQTIRNNSGLTPMEAAAEQGNQDVLTLLT